MYFNDLVGYISGLLKFWGLPNFGGLKPFLKWLYGWAALVMDHQRSSTEDDAGTRRVRQNKLYVRLLLLLFSGVFLSTFFISLPHISTF
jgi:hypothetical protein